MSNRNARPQSRTSNLLKSNRISLSNRKFLMVFIECAGLPLSPEAPASGIYIRPAARRSPGADMSRPLRSAFMRVIYFPAIARGSVQIRKELIEDEN
jgi:hypothetical protein